MGAYVSSTQALQWLKNDVFPIWSTRGFNKPCGCFVEALSRQGEPLDVPLRAMVQARQIFSFAEAWRLKLLEKSQVLELINPATEFLIRNYSLPSGAFAHSTDSHGKIINTLPDLYAQAFVVFGLAQTFELTGQKEIKDRAKSCIAYLQRDRRSLNRGFTELENNQPVYASNPHMHLFEAALAWMRIDTDPIWGNLAEEIFELCQKQFIDPVSGALCEKFDSNWKPLRPNGQFVFEPGHHFEWAWLMLEFEKLSSRSAGQTPARLFDLAEAWGLHPQTGLAIDEVWSDRQPKKLSSRFWPQGERVKAAVALGRHHAADQALSGLFRFLNSPAAGLWEDTLDSSGKFSEQPIKASSLYHIINAISEYVQKR